MRLRYLVVTVLMLSAPAKAYPAALVTSLGDMVIKPISYVHEPQTYGDVCRVITLKFNEFGEVAKPET